jgi:ATP-dependent Clp endopeptidase proteolytic subunit ClpP
MRLSSTFLAATAATILSVSTDAFTSIKYRNPTKTCLFLQRSEMGYSNNLGRDFRMDEPEPEIDPRRKNPDEKPPAAPVRMPVIDTGSGQMDVISRLLKDRILLLGQKVDDDVANVLVAQLLYLANEDPTKDITLYINSPGGSVSAGMAIYDTMQYVPCDVSTVCFGMAASMGSFLLGAGAKGKRKSLPNARIMIHQPLGGAQGQASDIEIQAKEILFIREVLNTYIAEYTDQPKSKIEDDCDRDFFMTAEEALEYGIIDEVLVTKTSSITKPAMPSLY